MIGLGAGPPELVVTATVEVPVALQLRASRASGKVCGYVVPSHIAVALHVVVGDLIGDALIAERCDQPIKDRRGFAVSYCRPDTISYKVGANLVDEIGGPGQAANSINQPVRMFDCGWPVVNFGVFFAVGLAMLNCRRGDHGSNHRDQFALRIAVTVDVPLRGLD